MYNKTLEVLVKIRAHVFYQDLKLEPKTRTANILSGLKSSSSCELIDKVFFKIKLQLTKPRKSKLKFMQTNANL